MNQNFPEENLVANRYQLLAQIGEGGMGKVYKAEDTIAKKTVALKFMVSKDAKANARFLREARVMDNLQHPNIVQFKDFGQHKGMPFIAMELVEGKCFLSEKFAPNQNVEIAIKCLNTLCYAHSKGVVHRDIKPSNIMITQDNHPKIMDFGIAKSNQDVTKLTQASTAIGSLAYMSPEQLNSEKIDARSDVYSMGIVLFQALEGKPPFEGTTERVLFQVFSQKPKFANQDVPAVLKEICFKALEKKAIDRYQSAQEFSQDLQNYLSGKKVSKKSKIPRKKTKYSQEKSRRKQPTQKNYTIAIILGFNAVAILLFFSIYSIAGAKQDHKNKDRVTKPFENKDHLANISGNQDHLAKTSENKDRVTKPSENKNHLAKTSRNTTQKNIAKNEDSGNSQKKVIAFLNKEGSQGIKCTALGSVEDPYGRWGLALNNRQAYIQFDFFVENLSEQSSLTLKISHIMYPNRNVFKGFRHGLIDISVNQNLFLKSYYCRKVDFFDISRFIQSGRNTVIIRLSKVSATMYLFQRIEITQYSNIDRPINIDIPKWKPYNNFTIAYFTGDKEVIRGRGIFRNQNLVLSYHGTWQNYLPHGKGSFTYKHSNENIAYHYHGNVQQGKKHGKGVMVKWNGDLYKGFFANDQYHGKGILVRRSDLSKLSGYWEKGTFIGKSD